MEDTLLTTSSGERAGDSAQEGRDMPVVWSLAGFIATLEERKAHLEPGPMFSERGKPLSLAGHVAVEMGWRRSRRGARNKAADGRTPRQVLKEAFHLSDQEADALQKAEHGATYRKVPDIYARLRSFCDDNVWTQEERLVLSPSRAVEGEETGLWAGSVGQEAAQRVTGDAGAGTVEVVPLPRILEAERGSAERTEGAASSAAIGRQPPHIIEPFPFMQSARVRKRHGGLSRVLTVVMVAAVLTVLTTVVLGWFPLS